MTNPLVSVVLPTRNRARSLPRAIASVLAQTYDTLELIVVNDGSTDRTEEILAAQSDPRLRVISREGGQGAGAARNAGLEAARGEWVAFQDDDDVWLMHKLERQILAVQASNGRVDWCICGNIRLAQDGCRYIGGAFHQGQVNFDEGIGQRGHDWGLIATPGWLVHKELLDRVGPFDVRIRSWDDWELALRMSKAAKPHFLDEPLWVQDWLSGGGLTRSPLVRANDMKLIMEKHGETWRDRPDVRARHYYYIGRMLGLHESTQSGRPYLLRSLAASPFHLETWGALALSCLKQEWMLGVTALIRRARALLG